MRARLEAEQAQGKDEAPDATLQAAQQVLAEQGPDSTAYVPGQRTDISFLDPINHADTPPVAVSPQGRTCSSRSSGTTTSPCAAAAGTSSCAASSCQARCPLRLHEPALTA